MVQTQMHLVGINRRTYTPASPPPHVVAPRATRAGSGSGGEVPVFEPYEETLPLQSGYYSFVIDAEGYFRVKRGNTRSHAAMVSDAPACTAGHLRVNRAGNTVHVVCGCTDYRVSERKESTRYIIQAFESHTAFSLSSNAVFQFQLRPTEKFFLGVDASPIVDPWERLRLLDEEGLGDSVSVVYTPTQVIRFENYHPSAPPRLYSMHRDQLVTAVEGTDDEGFQTGAPAPRLDLAQTEFREGKANFVIDAEGWLIVGVTGHQILSGGIEIAGAGHIHFDATGATTKIDLNFSGHYRPPLTGDYVRYVYRIIRDHPLITLAPDCRLSGRWFDESSVDTRVVQFDRDELEADDPRLDEWIESYLW